jgi:hypothetical protein
MILKVPSSFAELKVGQLIEINKLKDMETGIRKRVRLAEALTRIDYETIIKMPMSALLEIEQACMFVFDEPQVKPIKTSYLIDGLYYEPILDLSKATAGQYIDAKTIINTGNVVNDIHRLISCFLIPRGKKYSVEVYEDTCNAVYKDMSVEDAYSLQVFFCKVFNLLTSDFQTYTVKETMDKALMTLHSNGIGGI